MPSVKLARQTNSPRVTIKTGFFTALVALACGHQRLAADEPPPPNKPDLDVTYIAQRPLYTGYWMDYPDDVPTFWVPDAKAPDGKKTVTKEEFQRLTKYQHAPGDKVTFTAHVRNNGFGPAPATHYRLYLDDKVVKEGDTNRWRRTRRRAAPTSGSTRTAGIRLPARSTPTARLTRSPRRITG
jgi:hypothetical protein